MAGGLPFPEDMSQNQIARIEAKQAFEELRREAADFPEMTLDEINEEIRLYREGK